VAKSKNNVKKSNMKNLLAVVLATIAVYSLVSFLGRNDIAASSVMITNPTGNHGGTGVILSSSQNKSLILTNSHVCKLVEKGGLVKTKTAEYAVTSYKHSKAHDICLISVDSDLGVNTKVSRSTPTPYYQEAFVSGHPALMPNVITRGHFSGRRVISIMVGVKVCSEEDMRDEGKAMMCLMLGGVPDLRQFDSTLVTATIMPGSSGSGVYNDKNELTGLVFAGGGDLGYAWTVPYETLRNFLDKERNTIEEIRPSNQVEISAQGPRLKKEDSFNETEAMDKVYETCSKNDKASLKSICDNLSGDIVWRKK
jgi:S1-C subfamily serine protease